MLTIVASKDINVLPEINEYLKQYSKFVLVEGDHNICHNDNVKVITSIVDLSIVDFVDNI